MRKVISDKEKYFKKHISPLLEQVYSMCEAQDIPFFVCLQIITTETGGTLSSSYFNPEKKELQCEKLELMSAIATGQAKSLHVSPDDIKSGSFAEGIAAKILERIKEHAGDSDSDEVLEGKVKAPGSNTVN